MRKFLLQLISSDRFSDVLAYIAGVVMLIGFVGIVILLPRS